MLVRRHYLFYGRVQGVGFRFTTYQIACELNLSGWVRNLSDGSVEACFQGDESIIDCLIEKLNSDRFIRIDRIKCENLKVVENENIFEITH